MSDASDEFNVSSTQGADQQQPVRARVDRIAIDAEDGPSRNIFVKGAVVLVTIYAFAAFLFGLPPMPSELPSPVCDNIAAVEGDSNEIKREVAVILGPSDTFLNFSSVLEAERDGLLKKLLSENDTRVTVVLADGSPYTLSKSYIHAGFGEDLDLKVRDAIDTIESNYECLISTRVIDGQVDKISSTPGQNILTAMQIGANSFSADSDRRDIVVISNGIQTAGDFKFQSGFPSGIKGATQIVSQLKKQGSLGDLAQANVTWIGLGQTDGTKQLRLDEWEMKSLVQMWKTIVLGAGGNPDSIRVDTIPHSDPDENAITSAAVKGLPNPCVEVTATEDGGVRFVSNSSAFVSRDDAKSVAAGFAKKISQADCNANVVVTGYVASNADQDDFALNPDAGCGLSLARANAFRDLLRSSGVAVRIDTFAGCKGPKTDWNQDGKYVDSLGAENRIVTVTQ